MTVLSAGAQQLVLYGDNDADLYRQMFTPINKALVKRKVKGEYDATLAVKAFKNFADVVAQKFAKEVHGNAKDWFRLFPPSVREEAARDWRDTFEIEYKLGNYSHLAPAKYAHLAPKAKHKSGGGGAKAQPAKATTKPLAFRELPLTVMQGIGFGAAAVKDAKHHVSPSGEETIVVKLSTRPSSHGLRQTEQTWRRNKRKRDVQWERIDTRWA